MSTHMKELKQKYRDETKVLHRQLDNSSVVLSANSNFSSSLSARKHTKHQFLPGRNKKNPTASSASQWTLSTSTGKRQCNSSNSQGFEIQSNVISITDPEDNNDAKIQRHKNPVFASVQQSVNSSSCVGKELQFASGESHRPSNLTNVRFANSLQLCKLLIIIEHVGFLS